MEEDRQSRFEFDQATQAKFSEYHAANPKVYEMLKRFALQMRNAGRTRLSINMLFERVRWETQLQTAGDTFKMNNNYRAYYARLLMESEPQLTGMFETRKAKADDLQ